jgi:aspartate aminotransferase-like enzyme
VVVPDRLDGKALVNLLKDRYNVTVAGGQGAAAGKIFRIGHMGDLDEFDMITVVAALEMALAQLGYPVKIGEGTGAATQMLRELGFGDAPS